MDIETILSSGLINTAKLAREIWNIDKGDKLACKSAAIRLHQKINLKNKQRLTENDLILIENYLKNIFK